jgi:uncharacterized protein (UPF0335 family)
MADNIGHNSEVRGFIERIERLAEQKKEISDDIRDVYKEAESQNINAKALREVIRLRKMDNQLRVALEETVEQYKMALGMLGDLPLGKAAIEQQARKSVMP